MNTETTYQDLLSEFEAAYAAHGTTDLTLFRCGEGGLPQEHIDGRMGSGDISITGVMNGCLVAPGSKAGDNATDVYLSLAKKAGSRLAADCIIKIETTGHIGPGDIWCAYFFEHGDYQDLPGGIRKLQNLFLQSIRLIKGLVGCHGPDTVAQPKVKPIRRGQLQKIISILLRDFPHIATPSEMTELANAQLTKLGYRPTSVASIKSNKAWTSRKNNPAKVVDR